MIVVTLGAVGNAVAGVVTLAALAAWGLADEVAFLGIGVLGAIFTTAMWFLRGGARGSSPRQAGREVPRHIHGDIPICNANFTGRHQLFGATAGDACGDVDGPRARAAARPARVRSRMMSRSNSAIAPKTWNSSFPPGVAVSMASVSDRNSTPRAANR